MMRVPRETMELVQYTKLKNHIRFYASIHQWTANSIFEIYHHKSDYGSTSKANSVNQKLRCYTSDEGFGCAPLKSLSDVSQLLMRELPAQTQPSDGKI